MENNHLNSHSRKKKQKLKISELRNKFKKNKNRRQKNWLCQKSVFENINKIHKLLARKKMGRGD